MAYTSEFLELIEYYSGRAIEFPDLKAVTVAVWILESGRGSLGLASNHRNFAGMKYHSDITDWAKRVHYNAHDGKGYYCEFESLSDFVSGYWAFLDRSLYDGWRNFGKDPDGFINHVGPIWAEDPNYVGKVLGLISEAEALLDEANSGTDVVDLDDGDLDGSPGMLLPGRPSISISADGKRANGQDGLEIEYRGVDSCPYGVSASNNKKPFSAIVLHHTSPRHDTEWYIQYQIDGDPARGGHFGYHFYIAPDGTIYQGAPLTKRTNHVNPKGSVRRPFGRNAQNTNAIGITLSGAGLPQGYTPTRQQIEVQYELVFALCDAFDIPFSDVFGHGEIQTNRHKTEGRDTAMEIRGWTD